MKDKMCLTAVALTLSTASSGLAGCDKKIKETAAKTETTDKRAGGAQAVDTQASGGQAEDDQEEGSRITDGKRRKMALYLSGAANNTGWCQSAYDGLEFLEVDYGCEVTYTENLTPDDTEAAFADYVVSGYDVVIGHGHEPEDPMIDVAEQYPDTKFTVTEGETSVDNVTPYMPKHEKDGYTIGILAAGMFESGEASFIGSIQDAFLVKIMNGFEGGAKGVNPGIQVQTTWTGSFIDAAFGKEATQAMIDSDADVIGYCANGPRTGAINAARKAKAHATGDSHDQNDLAPDTILSSSVYHIPHMIEVTFKTAADGTFEGGINQPGMADGIAGVASRHNLGSVVPDELKQRIPDKIAAIGSGTFEMICDVKLRT